MSGVVLETLSWKKLGIFISIVFCCQLVCFLVGGFIAPTPHGHTNVLTEKCIDNNPSIHFNKWFYTRLEGGEITCNDVLQTGPGEKTFSRKNLTADQIVFAAQFPLPRDGISLNMSRWFQQLIGVLNTDIKFMKEIEMDTETMLTLDVRLGYRNKGDLKWTEMARSREVRPLRCKLDDDTRKRLKSGHTIDGYYYDCEILPLFSLGSCFYEEYLLNIRIPMDRERKINTGLGQLEDLWVVEIHQNGGFTIVWFILKTIMFPLTLSSLVFFWYRITLLDRKSNLLEQTIIALGICMSILNLPVEWLSLKYNLSFWLVLSDIRQGGFYAMLLCFWVVFTGEHLLEDSGTAQSVASYKSAKERLYHYWPQLIPVGAASCFLFIFELAERGVQLNNPFYSVWSHKTTAHIAIAFVAMAAICGPLYFIFLFYKVIKAVRQMLNKRSILPSLPEVRRRFYSGVIYRFTLFIIYTLLCATLTIIFFIVSQIDESQWKWGKKKLEYTSAFITGVYGMWNFYVISILCLYAPSHKYLKKDPMSDTDNLLSKSKDVNDSVVVQYYGNDLATDDGNVNIAFKNKFKKDISVETLQSEQIRTISQPSQPIAETMVFLNKASKY